MWANADRIEELVCRSIHPAHIRVDPVDQPGASISGIE